MALAKKHAGITQRIIGIIVLSIMVVIPSATNSYAVEAQPQIQASMPAVVDLNKADVEQLQAVRGIGPALAERIIQYRDEHGRFEHIEDLTNVRGIGQAKFNKIQTQLKV